MWRIRKGLSVTAVLFLALLNLHVCVQGNARQYYMENLVKTPSKTGQENLNYEPEYHECYITVQETRKIGGQCVKIHENIQGCVAGSLMDPFHKDCL